MLKTIFAIIIIGITSNAGAAQLTIAEKLEDIMNSKEQIRRAIEERGVSVPSNTPLSQYASKIRQNVWRAHDSLTNICSAPAVISKFPYLPCSGRQYSATNYTSNGTGCTLPSGSTGNIYGKARCSNTSGAWTIQGNPTDNPGTGQNCWCRICTDNSLETCGGWVFFMSASDCATSCAYICSAELRGDYGRGTFRDALCSPPAP